MLNGPVIVDTFFVISGFLACFLLLERCTTQVHSIKYLQLCLHRLIRLLPQYAVIVAFYCTLLAKLGSGPLWKEKVLLEQERCRETWWTNLLFLNNYIHTDKIVSIVALLYNTEKKIIFVFSVYYKHGSLLVMCIFS